MIPTVSVTCESFDQNGNPIAGARFEAKLDRTEVYDGFVVPEKVTAFADANGVCVLELWPNALGANASSYQIKAWNPDTGKRFLDTTAVVPNSDCRLEQIIVAEPYPAVDAAQQALIAAQGALAPVTAQAQAAAASALVAQDAEDGALAAETAAQASAAAAQASEQAAATSEASASSSATTATGAAQTATQAADEAEAARDAAQAAATTSTAQATAAGESAHAAGLSANLAALSEGAAAGSESAAQGHATAAAASANTAQAQATAAQQAKIDAQAAASTAQAAAAQAEDSADAAAGQAGLAISAANNASGYASTAGTHAATATTKAGEASTSASLATAKASEADTSAAAAAADRVQTGLDAQATAADRAQVATDASTSAANAATANLKAGEAAGSAAQALAIYGDTTAVQTAVAQAAAQASLAAGYAASASSVVQQDLSGINAAALHRSPNAVTAMFVYDTSKDSDGGAWTEKCQHTSWYNEPINGKWLGAQASEAAARAVSGATTGDYFQRTTDGLFYSLNAGSGITQVFRGNKRDFPRLSAIVAEGTGVTIYDLTEPGRPMWGRWDLAPVGFNINHRALAAVNGQVAVGTESGCWVMMFPADRVEVNQSANYSIGRLTNHSKQVYQKISTAARIANNGVNAVAMTVLPDAPVDPVTGLKVPTIAVANGGGTSFILQNGAVSTATWGARASASSFVSFDQSGNLTDVGTPSGGSARVVRQWSGVSTVVGYFNTYDFPSDRPHYSPVRYPTIRAIVAKKAALGIGSFDLFSLLKVRRDIPTGSLSAYITSTYNTGHQPGDIRRTYLSDVDAGSVTGPELVTNGDFASTDVSAWLDTSYSATVSVVNGELVLNATAGSGRKAYPVATTIGKTYVLVATVRSGGAGTAGIGIYNVQAGIGTSVATGTGSTSNVVITQYFTATQSTHYIVVSEFSASSGTTHYFDNISFKEVIYDRSYKAKAANITGTLTKTQVASAAQLVAYSGFSAANYLREPYSADLDFGTGEWSVGAWVNVPVQPFNFPVTGSELVANGTFDADITGWTFDGTSGSQSWESGKLRVVSGSNFARSYTTITTVIGKTYRVRCNSTNISGVNTGAYISKADNAAGGTNAVFSTIGAAGDKALVFTATATTTYILVGSSTSSSTNDFDNVSIQEVVSPALIADRAHSSGAKLHLGVTGTGLLTATAYDGTTTRTVTTTAAYNTGTWLKAEADYTTDGTLSISVNGVEVAATRGNPLLSLNNPNAVLTIGNSFNLDAPFPGSIALLKLSATVPTAEQSVWMYEQEKQMFREGAQVCLPDSGAIADLAYDEATDKWIAVSAANESEWSGLVRTSVTPVPAGSYSRVTAGGGVQMLARTTTNPGVDITIPAYGLREELVRRAEAAARLNAQLATFDYVGGFTASTTTGNTAITSVAGLTYPTSYIGARVSGAGIPANTTIVAVSGTTIYLSAAATATATGVQISFVDYVLPVGYEAKEVSLAGAAQREGATQAWQRLFDGFKETVRFNTAPSNTALVQIQAARSAA